MSSSRLPHHFVTLTLTLRFSEHTLILTLTLTVHWLQRSRTIRLVARVFVGRKMQTLVLVYCQFSSTFVQKSKKEVRVTIFVDESARNNRRLFRRRYLQPFNFRQIPISSTCFKAEVENVSANQKLGRPSLLTNRP